MAMDYKKCRVAGLWEKLKDDGKGGAWRFTVGSVKLGDLINHVQRLNRELDGDKDREVSIWVLDNNKRPGKKDPDFQVFLEAREEQQRPQRRPDPDWVRDPGEDDE